MARTTERLNSLQVKRLKEPGRFHDGGGLYLAVKPGGSKNWLFRYRTHWMGLGAFPTFGLAEARERATAARRLLSDGKDPIEQRRRDRAAARGTITFREAAKRYIEAHRAGWKNPKHIAQWGSTIATYVEPVFGETPVGEVDTDLVMRVLQGLWQEKPETASRLRGRIEVILDWAKVRGYRDGENPARWKGHLDHLLAPKAKMKKQARAIAGRSEGHAALDIKSIPAFMVDLRQREAVAARALEFLILCASRTSEALEARWSEIDLDGKTWVIPPSRMKAGKEHRVPLSDRALEILTEMQAIRRRGDDVVFPGQKRGKAPSNMALLMLLRRMGRGDLTAHGFRSTFRDWVAEKTTFAGEVAEAALAHAIPDKTEAAYRRGDQLDKRRKLMDAWASYCAGPVDNVVVLRAKL